MVDIEVDKPRHLVAKFRTNTSGANWWSNLELIQVAPPGIPVYCLLLDSSEHREQHDYCNSRDTLLIRRCPLFQHGQSQGRLHTGYEEETNEFWDFFFFFFINSVQAKITK